MGKSCLRPARPNVPIRNAASLKSRSVNVQEQGARLVNIEFLRDLKHNSSHLPFGSTRTDLVAE
jgi:hypothetical protein